MKPIIIIALLFCFSYVNGQVRGEELEKSYDDGFNKYIKEHDAQCDSLIYNGRTYFFRRTPIHYLKGYTNVFKSDETALINQFGEKGYRMTWVIKNGQLYLSRIKLINGFVKFEKNEKGEVIEKPAMKKLTDTEINDCIERFTGVKFNKEGLLEANWVDGNELLYDMQQNLAAKSYEESHKQYHDIRTKCKEYQLVIRKGKVEGIKELGYYNSK